MRAAVLLLLGGVAVLQLLLWSGKDFAFVLAPAVAPTQEIPCNVTLLHPRGRDKASNLRAGCVYRPDGVYVGYPTKVYSSEYLTGSFTLRDIETRAQLKKKRFRKRGEAHQFVNELFKGQPGFFIESGGHDGCTMSHTIWLEQHRNWTGLLVEPNPALFEQIRQLKRHCWAVNCCLAVEGRVHRTEMILAGTLGIGGITSTLNRTMFDLLLHGHKASNTDTINATCVPLPVLLANVNGGKLADFWVLDVEGAEGMILENTPPSAKIVFVEHNAIVVKRDRIHAALVAAGYYRFLAEPQDDWYVLKSHCHEFDKCFEFPPEYIHPRFKTG